MKVVLHPAAIADLIAAGVGTSATGLGLDLLEETERAIEVIGDTPAA